MCVWDMEFYDNDYTYDVQGDYINFLKLGKSNIEATNEIIEINDDFYDEQEEIIFWLALADIQWKYGRLIPKVKNKALKILEKINKEIRAKDNITKNEKDLLKLEEKLSSEQPPEKKLAPFKMIKSMWNVGDIYAYKIRVSKSALESDNRWHGKYVLFKVIGVIRYNIGSLPKEKYYHEYSAVCMYNWVGDKIPNLEKIKKLEFVQECLMPWLNTDNQTIVDAKMAFYFNSRDLKKLSFQPVYKETNINNSNVISGNFVDIPTISNIDIGVKCLLRVADQQGKLIEEY